ncbi:MAG TPA: enoyl-CoA hydratase/isomerase family protein [Solirubrobacterales bacterium]|nr:enoyl-CoA hydratase/isomerase family protein [Solirubrobacterales bacterium]
MGDSPVEVRREGHLATIALADPERRNVLDAAMATALREAAEALAAEGEVRCAILTGSGTVFAAGADVNEIGSAGAEENLVYNRQLRAAVNAVAALPMPTVAAVNGHAIGGGLELALACTLRVASTEAKLGTPEARLGIIPATGGLARLPRLIGASRAARLLLTGDLVDGAEAERLGIVDAAVPAAQVADAARALAERIAAAAPLSTRAIVATLREDAGPIADANLRSEERLARLLASADRREGAAAFLERREPSFQGH